MKTKLFFILIMVAAVFSSCNKDKTAGENQPATPSELPTKASAYVDNNYPDASIEYVVAVTNSHASFLVTLNTADELAFDRTGEYLGFGSGYHNGQIMCDTIYEGHHDHGHHYGGIPVDSLSAVIIDYIAQNYPGYEILHAKIDTICPDGAVTIVFIGMEDTEHLMLYFGAGDVFLMQANRIFYADVPQAVKDYIDSSYADYDVRHKALKLTLPENILQFLIYLKEDYVKFSVRMAEDGTFICASDMDTIPGHHNGGDHHGGGHGGGHHGGGDHEGWIPADSLSAAILDYIANNYAGYDIMHAKYGNICPEGDVIEVAIVMPDSLPVRLIFGSDDAFLMSDIKLPYADVPQAVKDYITANYPDLMVRPMSEKLTLADNSIQYRIFLGHKESRKIVRIAEDGTLVCEQQQEDDD